MASAGANVRNGWPHHHLRLRTDADHAYLLPACLSRLGLGFSPPLMLIARAPVGHLPACLDSAAALLRYGTASTRPLIGWPGRPDPVPWGAAYSDIQQTPLPSPLATSQARRCTTSLSSGLMLYNLTRLDYSSLGGHEPR